MKISRIEIKDFHQFQNFELDLTYPKGHEKAGEPLDKVCFIGQSGTGKTTLLNICEEIIKYISKLYTSNVSKAVRNTFRITLPQRARFSDFKIHITQDSKYYFDIHYPKNWNSGKLKYMIDEFKKQHNHLLTFKDNDARSKIQEESQNIVEINLLQKENYWKSLKEKIVKHANEKSKYRIEISRAAENGDSDLLKEKVAQLKEWEKENPNPLSDLASNFLNPILEQFGLKTKIDLDSLAEAEFINLLDKNGNLVPQNVWSTGTKQVVFKVLPLYISKPESAIILIDEPENSLYPNIQTKIIDHYLRLAPTCQFFVATHSPIIAASFEPWEIVELKFDENGNVYREKYYKGENDIKNYHINPRYYKYGTVLKEIFDLDQEGPDSDFRNKQMMEASRLEVQIKRLNEEGKKEEAMKLYKKYKELASKLDWEVKI